MANQPIGKMRVRARMLYVTELMRQGYSNTEIIKKLQEKYKVGATTCRKDIKNAYEWLCNNDDSHYIEAVRAKQIERSEYILQQAVDAKDWNTANKIVDTLNKCLGLYENKQKVEIVGDEIRFKFGISDDNKTEKGNVDEC